MTSPWGVLVAEHNRFRIAQNALIDQGITHFIPMEEKTQVVNGRHARYYRPLLGDYVLFAVTAAWTSIRRLRGISGIIVNDQDEPALVLPEEVDYLKSICLGGVYRKRMIKSQSGFEYGQRVTPKEGPFAFHVGTFEHRNKKLDVALFSLFGQERRVKFKPGQLTAV